MTKAARAKKSSPMLSMMLPEVKRDYIKEIISIISLSNL